MTTKAPILRRLGRLHGIVTIEYISTGTEVVIEYIITNVTIEYNYIIYVQTW